MYSVPRHGPCCPNIPPRERKTGRYMVKPERSLTDFDRGRTRLLNRRGSCICKHLSTSGDSAKSVGLIFAEGSLP